MVALLPSTAASAYIPDSSELAVAGLQRATLVVGVRSGRRVGIDSDEPAQLDPARLRVDLDDGDVSSERKGRRGLELVLGLQLGEPPVGLALDEPVELSLGDFDSHGVTRARVAQRWLEVEQGIPGEVVSARVTTGKRPQGRIIEVLKAATDRVAPPCEYFRDWKWWRLSMAAHFLRRTDPPEARVRRCADGQRGARCPRRPGAHGGALAISFDRGRRPWAGTQVFGGARLLRSCPYATVLSRIP